MRGKIQEDSDYDVAVFLRDMPDRIAELYRLADLSSAILDETGAFIHAMAYRAGSYDERTPLMHGIMEFAPTVLTCEARSCPVPRKGARSSRTRWHNDGGWVDRRRREDGLPYRTSRGGKRLSLRLITGACIKGIQASRGNFRGW